MKFGVMFVNAGPFAFPEYLEILARTAEEAGFESIWTVEHVLIPLGYHSRYPYSSSGRLPGPESSPIADPIVPLAFAAAITKKVRLGTAIVILPQRHPAYVAKEMATLDVLSGGRAMLGIGIGWLKEEFDAVGVPFNQRAGRTDESIHAIRSLWKPTPEAFEGKFYKWGPVESNPKPLQQPGVPIIIGGHSDGAARRAARYGDGFFPMTDDPQVLASLLATMRAECAKIGRDPKEIEISMGTVGLDVTLDLDAARRAQDAGVGRLAIAPPAYDPDGLRRGLHEFAERVIVKL
jgi:probable F420-dependent oxidoreductase